MQRKHSALKMVADRLPDSIMQQPRDQTPSNTRIKGGVTVHNIPVEYRAVKPAELQPLAATY
jgi:hypothetical protein